MKGRVKVRDDIPRPCLIAMPQIHLPGEKHNSEKRFFFRLISRRRRSSNQSGTATLLRNIISSTRRSWFAYRQCHPHKTYKTLTKPLSENQFPYLAERNSAISVREINEKPRNQPNRAVGREGENVTVAFEELVVGGVRWRVWGGRLAIRSLSGNFNLSMV